MCLCFRFTCRHSRNSLLYASRLSIIPVLGMIPKLYLHGLLCLVAIALKGLATYELISSIRHASESICTCLCFLWKLHPAFCS
ncbi:hypothetical protein GDO81_006427 [Engystomops pustulosus]|uniref:NADH dehydrogenase subunit 4L n=1 Tax=Engystomops pustulosus TaxID=76066 RepID=A0AAV7CY43_ENGPU|nr:hypothetical protein GDO81_006427 [Engystomops pustulosus]